MVGAVQILTRIASTAQLDMAKSIAVELLKHCTGALITAVAAECVPAKQASSPPPASMHSYACLQR